jgi:hypothetical protein
MPIKKAARRLPLFTSHETLKSAPLVTQLGDDRQLGDRRRQFGLRLGVVDLRVLVQYQRDNLILFEELAHTPITSNVVENGREKHGYKAYTKTIDTYSSEV